jgi:oligopeptide transport system substrate-binding protein
LIDQQHPQGPYECEKNYPCNGPFEFKINQPNQGYQLIKNPYYWDTSHIFLDQISLTLVNPLQAFQAFQKKEIDWLGNPFGAWHSFYVPKKEDLLVTFPNSLVCWFVFNTAHPPFHHSKVREAFAHAIRRDSIAANAELPLNPAFSLFLPQGKRNQQCLFPEFDSKKARRLLREGLHELGMTKRNLSPLRLTYHEKGIRDHTAICLKQQFREHLEIECELQPLPWSATFNKMSEGHFQVGIEYWSPWIDDPLYTLNAFKFAKEKVNLSKWENAHYRRLLDLSEQEINLFQRSASLLEAEEILTKEMPIIPLYYQPLQALTRKDFHLYNKAGGPFNFSRSFYKKEV